MDINELKTRLKAKKYEGIYIFAGEEDYLVRYYLSSLRDSLGIDSALAVFNNPVFDGEKPDFSAIAEAVKAPPMMSDYKLIEWRHADFSAMRERELDALEELATLVAEYPYSIVAFTADGEGLDFGTQKKPSAFIKRFDKKINILRFEKSTENQLYSWLKKHFDSQGISVDLEALRALVFRSGKSMDILKSEVDKLSALAKARGKNSVTAKDVDEIASSTPESDTFALSNAIIDRNRQKAFLALEEMKARRVDPTVIMGMLSRTYDELLSVAHLLEEGVSAGRIEAMLKMNPYKLKLYVAAAKRYGVAHLSGVVSALAETDAGAKFGGITGYTAVEIFISRSI